MSAETLRAAARLMRERAEAATSKTRVVCEDWFEVEASGLALSLAVVRMFESLADWIEECDDLCHSWARYDHVHDAITVARTYLGETA